VIRAVTYVCVLGALAVFAHGATQRLAPAWQKATADMETNLSEKPIELQAHAAQVHDGRTLSVLDHAGHSLTVRIRGIVPPDSSSPVAIAARRSLEHLALDRNVHVRCTGIQLPAVLLCDVRAGSRDLATEQLDQGLARVDPSSSASADLIHLEQDARTRRVGIWSQSTQGGSSGHPASPGSRPSLDRG